MFAMPGKSHLAAMVVLGAVAASTAAISSSAQAQEAVTTAAPGAGAPAMAAAGPGPTLIPDRISERDDRGPVPIGPCGLPYKDDGAGPPKQDKSVHGVVWGGIGTHGYREAGGAVCIPAGKAAQVTIAVDAARINSR
jgi:hypothetical protein